MNLPDLHLTFAHPASLPNETGLPDANQVGRQKGY